MSWGSLVVCVSASILVAGAQSNEGESRVVQTAQGPVRGYKDSAIGGVFLFYNIPYATVKDRFKAPVAPPSWSEPFEAIDRGIRCAQRQGPGAGSGNSMIDDCLVVNVFVPDTEEISLPVLVNVHGGGFQVRHGDSERFRTLTMTKNIITVTFNYRLSILGFLCLGTENIPGNAGMKDQVALLRWVKQNIANFGGNPDDVTISGCSVGSASVNLLALSASTKGLFNKVISNSGASTGSFAVQTDPIKNAKTGAIALNFTDIDNLNALEEFYMTASLELLTSESFTGSENSEVIFGPCVERDTSEEKFLADAPYNLLRQGDYSRYPILYGITDMEGLNRFGQFSNWKDRMNEKFSDFLPADLQFVSEEQTEEVARAAKEFYFGSRPVGDETILEYIDYFTDVVFAYSVLFSTTLHQEAGNNTVYLYEYSFVDENTAVVAGTDVRGAGHCTQATAVFDQNEATLTEEYRQVKSIMRDIWANFIKTGQPILEGSSLPAWPPVGANRSPHLSVGRTIELKGPLLEQRGRFWDTIYEQHYRPPVSPYSINSASTCNSHISVYVTITYLCIFAAKIYDNMKME